MIVLDTHSRIAILDCRFSIVDWGLQSTTAPLRRESPPAYDRSLFIWVVCSRPAWLLMNFDYYIGYFVLALNPPAPFSRRHRSRGSEGGGSRAAVGRRDACAPRIRRTADPIKFLKFIRVQAGRGQIAQ